MDPQHKIVESAVTFLSSLVSTPETMGLTPAKHKMTVTSTSSHFGKKVVCRPRQLGYMCLSALGALDIEVAAGRRLEFTRLRPRIAKTRARMP
eukprot:6663973-Pyramimonas_sp.AAC.1